jgi:hypothetical protein
MAQRESRQFHSTYIFCGVVFLGFAIQVVGISMTDRNLKPLIVPAPALWRFVGNIGFGVSSAAPFLSMAALIKVKSAVKSIAGAGERKFIWTIVMLAVLLSLAEWLWSWGGHPTWYQGFSG